MISQLIEQPHLLGNYLGFSALSEIHSVWIKKYWNSKTDTVLLAHRNSYKTTALLVVGPIWYLLQNPEMTILIVRKDYEGAAAIVSAISRLYDSPKMQYIYKGLGFTPVRKIEDNKNRITLNSKKNITKEGNIESIGIGGSITGSHYDKIFCDDIATIKDRVSRAEREKTKTFIRELQNVKKSDGTLTFSGTLWHPDDIYSILPAADKYPYGSIDIPELTPEIINQIKERTTPSLFAINYLLKYITDENKLFAEAQYAEFKIEYSGIIGHIDTAYSGKHFTAFTLMEKIGDKIIIKGWVWRENIVNLYATIANKLRENNAGTCWIEENADKGLSKTAMRNYYPNTQGYHEKENKHNKIIGYLKYNWKDVYFAYDCQDEYINQILDYAEGQEPDDAIDSAASAVRLLVKNIIPENSVSIKEVENEYQY